MTEVATGIVREHQCPLCHMVLYIVDDRLGEYCCDAHKKIGEANMRVIPKGHIMKFCSVCLKEYDAGPPSRAGRRQHCSVACQRKGQSLDMLMIK